MVEVGETHTNKNGGRSTKLRTVFTELPPYAMNEIAAVLGDGAAKYGSKNWHDLSVNEELDHALEHTFRFLITGELEELSHAATRMAMALDQHLRERINENNHENNRSNDTKAKDSLELLG